MEKTKKLPVWLYWEGQCPDWIKACRRTIFAHYSQVRLLTPETFDSLWDRDRDIDISKLIIAHRADFIRAFLVARYGGLWIDSDCLVMHSLDSICKVIEQTQFLAHRERSGDISNGFIGARLDSNIAAEFYQQICRILRSERTLGWTSIGSQPLTQILNKHTSAWHELDCERIQPVCWRDSETFFIKSTNEEHEQRFDPAAVCYMLSYNEIKKCQKTNPDRELFEQGTFFTYLLDRALKPEKSLPDDKKTVMNNKPSLNIPLSIEALISITPERVLDVGAGYGRWGVFLREFYESHTKQQESSWHLKLEGICYTSVGKLEYLHTLYDRMHCGDIANTFLSIEERWNLIVLGNILTKPDQELRQHIINKAMEIADYVIVDQTFEVDDESLENRYSNMITIPYSIYRHRVSQEKAISLLSADEPKQLCPALPYQDVFTTIFKDNLCNGGESASGPGSCFAQTHEIPRGLPLILAKLSISSLLDAPCGDFNWMKHVSLEISRYIGADIIPELIALNREKYSQAGREFIVANLVADSLPKADVIFCCDFLVHLPVQEIYRVLKNFKRSGATYLLTTTFTRNRPHQDISVGEWRPINFCLAPFNFPEPLRLLNEKCTENGGVYSDKSLSLWRLSDIIL